MRNLLLLLTPLLLVAVVLALYPRSIKPVRSAPPPPPIPGNSASDFTSPSQGLPDQTNAEAEPPPKPVVQPTTSDRKWEIAYKDDFSAAASVKNYTPYRDSELLWNEKHQAMNLKAGPQSREAYAAVHKSLPGDLRVRFRALRRKNAPEVSVGIIFGCQGSLQVEHGYFVEWAGGTAHVKRQKAEQIRVQAPTPDTKDRWVNLELQRVGATIRMFVEGAEVLNWTDPQPMADSEHDLLVFYVWDESTLIDNLVIERNPDDRVTPRAEDPATKENIHGIAKPLDTPVPGDF
jgi:hypothetical protein